MTAVWRKHLIICVLLGLLAVPMYFLDLAFTGEGGGSWITLDFRGLIFWTYITWLAIHVAFKFNYRPVISQVRSIAHSLLVIGLSVILLAAGFVVYGKLLRARAI